MIVLGLTGSIGMGKTTAGAMLKEMGCAIHDADKAVHQALEPKGDAFEEVALTFPSVWDKKKRVLKRDALADIIFKDTNQRHVLEQILHPVVQRSQIKFLKVQNRMERRVVVLDIPLLFETGAQARVDYTLVVSAPCHVQRMRVLKRQGMSEEKFQHILKTQMPDTQKRHLADFVVPTGMGLSLIHI